MAYITKVSYFVKKNWVLVKQILAFLSLKRFQVFINQLNFHSGVDIQNKNKDILREAERPHDD